MPSFEFRKNLLISLLILAIILLAANIIFKDDSVSSELDTNIDENEISTRFRNVLYEFGIEEKLIRQSKWKDKSSGREIPAFKIQVPKDLSIPEILLGLYQSFFTDSLNLDSVEKVKGGKSFLYIKKEKSVLLQSEFDYSKTQSRNKCSISFILNDAVPMDQSNHELIESPEKLNFLIRPESKNLEGIDFLVKNGKQYSVLIDDDISEQKYELGVSHSEQRVRTVVKTLVTDFRNAVCFVADDNSVFYNSSNYRVFEEELSKRKIKLHRLSDFVTLADDETILASFEEQLKNTEGGQSIIFLLDKSIYLKLAPDLDRYERMGHKIILSSLIL